MLDHRSRGRVRREGLLQRGLQLHAASAVVGDLANCGGSTGCNLTKANLENATFRGNWRQQDVVELGQKTHLG